MDSPQIGRAGIASPNVMKRVTDGIINMNRMRASTTSVLPDVTDQQKPNNVSEYESEVDTDHRRSVPDAYVSQDIRASLGRAPARESKPQLVRSTSAKLGNLISSTRVANVERRDAIRNSSSLKSLEDSIQKKVKFISAYKNIIFLILIMFTTYIIIFVYLPGWFYLDSNGEPVKKESISYYDRLVDSIYFTATQISTVGFGDICPKNKVAKGVVSIYHMVCFIITIGVMNIMTTDLSRSIDIGKMFSKK